MRARNCRKAVFLVELCGNVGPEGVAGASGGDAPTIAVVRVGPQKVTHRAFVRHLDDAIDGADLVESLQTGRQTSVKTEDFILDDSCERQVVEQVGQVFPDVRVSVLANAFIVEAIHLRNLSTFVVTAQDGDAFFEADLQTQKKGHSFYGVVPAVHVVSHKQVVRVRRPASDLEEFHQIVELAVNITADCDGNPHWLRICLKH